MKVIDLRSDTVTKPTQAMRDAMHTADVGDDVYGEDPTVNKLEETCAERFGKEAGLFVASGTMGNLVSLLTYCGRADQAIIGQQSHIALHERGGCAALGGIFPQLIVNHHDGTLPLDLVEAAINPEDPHLGRTKLVAIENTFNGKVIRMGYVRQLCSLAHAHNLSVHLDGARIFNAVVAEDLPVSELVEDIDSVQFCFSKGLAAPVGSMVLGRRDFIAEARNMRKMVGGGMRQAGVLAAACLVALNTMVDRLKEDHDNQAVLAAGLSDLKGVVVDSAETNMVWLKVTDASVDANDLVQSLAKEGVLTLALDKTTIRAVTHYGIEAKDIDEVVRVFHRVLKEADRRQATSSSRS